MPEMLRDGTGKGYLARINDDNQMVTRSIAVEQRLKSTVDGNYFECTTGQQTLTNATETSVMYLRNDDTAGRFMIVDRLFLDTWTSSNGSGNDGTLRYYKNAAVTGGTALTPVNTNYTSAASAPSVSSSAATGAFTTAHASMSGTVWWVERITDKLSLNWSEGAFCLPPGASHGITIAAPTSNTSMKYNLNVGFFYLDTTRI